MLRHFSQILERGVPPPARSAEAQTIQRIQRPKKQDSKALCSVVYTVKRNSVGRANLRSTRSYTGHIEYCRSRDPMNSWGPAHSASANPLARHPQKRQQTKIGRPKKLGGHDTSGPPEKYSLELYIYYI